MSGSTRSYPQGNYNSSSALASSTTNEAAGGVIGYTEIVTNSSGTTTTTNWDEITSVPCNGGRLIRITAEGVLRCTQAAGLQAQILEDGVEIGRRDFFVRGSAQDAEFHITALSHAPSAGNHTYVLAIGIAGSGGTATGIADSTAPRKAYIIAEDCGPDF